MVLEGRLSIREEEAPKLLVETITPLEEWTPGGWTPAPRPPGPPLRRPPQGPAPKTDAQWAQEAPAKLFLRLPRNLLEDATARLALHPGSVPVYLHIPAEKLTLLSPRTSWCDGSPACLDRLRELLGADNVKLTEK